MPALLGLAALLLPMVVLANGAIVGHVESGAATGTIRPLVQSKVVLKRETLRVEFAASDTYQVLARYSLVNTGAPGPITYGVPVYEPNAFWYDYSGPTRFSYSRQDLVSRIRVTLSGQERGCTLQRGPSVPDLFPAPFQPAASLSASSAGIFVGYCVLTLDVPEGPFELSLAYSGELFSSTTIPASSSEGEAESEELRRCKTADCEKRLKKLEQYLEEQSRPLTTEFVFHYPFAGAGTWGGRLAPVDVEMVFGDKEVVAGAPQNAKRTRNGLKWSAAISTESTDLELILRKRGATPPAAMQRDAWSPLTFKAVRASSFIAAEGKRSYGPEKAVDRDPTTAWCAKNERAGVGEWIELELTKSVEGGLVAWGVVTGLTRNEATWLSNARPATLQLGACAGENNADWVWATVDLRGADDFLRAAVVKMPNERLQPETSCFRFTVAAVHAGSKYPEFCISELSGALRETWWR